MTAGAANDIHLVWPAEHFYWALLDASVLPKRMWRRHHDPDRLGYLFEAQLPVALEALQVVYLPLGNDQFLACGVEHERLDQDVPTSALTLRPVGIPPELLNGASIDGAAISLLVDRHEPPPVRTQRRRFNRDVAVLAICLLAVALIGIGWRVQKLNAEVEELAQRRERIYQQLYDPGLMPPSTQPHSVRLTAELRQLRRTRSQDSRADHQEPESALALQALFAQWPPGHQVQTESLSITPTTATLIALLPSGQEAQAFVSAFMAPQGWDIRQPQLSAVNEGVRLTLRFVRRASEGSDKIASTSGDGVGP